VIPLNNIASLITNSSPLFDDKATFESPAGRLPAELDIPALIR